MSFKTRIVTIALSATILAVSAAGAFAHSSHPGSWWWFQHHDHFNHFYYGYPHGVCFGTWRGEICIIS